MIARLRGILDYVDDDCIIVDVNAVGYAVMVSPRTQAALPAAGEQIDLHIYTRNGDDGIALFGFLSRSELQCFRMLLAVPGVGARVAQAILSQLPPQPLGAAIAAGDIAAVSQAPGVGKRIATRVTSELAGKLALWPKEVSDNLSPAAEENHEYALTVAAPHLADAISALVNLGYTRTAAASMAQHADAILAKSPPPAAAKDQSSAATDDSHPPISGNTTASERDPPPVAADRTAELIKIALSGAAHTADTK